jgi:hypothetical protein
MTTLFALAVLALLALPFVYWTFRLAWWLACTALVCVLALLSLAGHAWRGELDQ